MTDERLNYCNGLRGDIRMLESARRILEADIPTGITISGGKDSVFIQKETQDELAKTVRAILEEKKKQYKEA